MSKKDAAKKPRPVHTRHCHDDNESAKAADSCVLEWERPDVQQDINLEADISDRKSLILCQCAVDQCSLTVFSVVFYRLF